MKSIDLKQMGMVNGGQREAYCDMYAAFIGYHQMGILNDLGYDLMEYYGNKCAG